MHEPTDNFNTRLRVETTFAEGDVRDHRSGFSQREYFRNMQDEQKPKDEPKGFPAMKGVVKAPRKKTKAELELQKANSKDLKQRNIK